MKISKLLSPEKQKKVKEGVIPYLEISDIDTKSKTYVLKDKGSVKGSVNAKKDSILVSTVRPSRGAIAIVKENELAVSNAIAILKVNESICHPKYLFYALNNKNFFKYLHKNSKGATYPTCSKEDIYNYNINYFEYAKQIKIVYKLDLATKIIENKKQQLTKYDQLIRSQFDEMFGDIRTNSKRLKSRKGKDLFKFMSGKFLSKEKRFNLGVPVYGGNGVAWYTREPLIDFPTIVIGRVGAYCGNINIVKEPIWITDNAIYIKEFYDNSFNLEFLFFMMSMMDFSRFADFSGQPKITQKPLEDKMYLIPEKQAQEEFSKFVRHIDKLKLIVRSSLNETEQLFESLMQEYFG
jgi:type I restriction enzyme S subunit